MIIDAIVLIFYSLLYILTLPIASLADASLPAEIDNAISQATNYLSMANAILPVSTLITILGLILLIEAGIMTYKIIMWVIRKIPTIS